MKKYLLNTLFIGLSFNAYAQIGIGSTTIANNAVLDINSNTNKGLLIPRVVFSSPDLKSTTTPILNPASGLIAYNNDTNATPTQIDGIYLRVDDDWRLLSSEDNKSTNLILTNTHKELAKSVTLDGTYRNFDTNFTVFANNISGSSYSNNVITLPKGRYFGKITLTLTAPAALTTGVVGKAIHKVTYKIRLVDENNNVVSNEYITNSTSRATNQSRQTIVGKLNFSVPQTKNLRLQIAVNTDNSTYSGSFSYYEGSIHLFRGISK